MSVALQTSPSAEHQQTDIGPIPADWRLVRMGDIGQTLAGLTYSPSDVRSDGVLVLRSSNVQDGRLAYSDNVFVQMDIPSRAIVREGDILICVRNGSRDLIGKCARIDSNAAGVAFGAFMGVFRSSINDLVHFSFQADSIQRQIREHLGATINQITNKSLNSFLIAVPSSEPEAHRIAGALSDADSLIKSLESLIAKKRATKHGAMHELLSGRRRLEGFSAAWTSKPLGDLYSFKNGLNKSKEFFGAGTPIVNYMDVFSSPHVTAHHIRGRVTVKATEKDNYSARIGDVFFTRTSETVEEIGLATVLINEIEDAVFSGFVLRARPKREELDAIFSGYALRSQEVRRQIIATASYTTRALTNGSLLSAVTLAFPSRDEQLAIGATLFEMDEELDALTARLAKARRIKQGMMQELLTGRVRLG